MCCCPTRCHAWLLASYDRLSLRAKRVVRLLAVLGFLGIGVGAFAATETKACESEEVLAVYEESTVIEDACMEPFTIVDALYLTLATISTCGYGDFSPKATQEKIIIAFVLLLGVTIFSLVMNNLMEVLKNFK